VNNNGTNDVPVGTCLAWLNRLPGCPVLPGHSEPEPVDITYHTTWPTDALIGS